MQTIWGLGEGRQKIGGMWNGAEGGKKAGGPMAGWSADQVVRLDPNALIQPLNFAGA